MEVTAQEHRPNGRAPRRSVVVGAVFVSLVLVYLVSPVVEYGDGRNTGPTVASVVTEGDLDIDEFADVSWFGQYQTVVVDGSSYDFYPWTRSVFALPVAVVVEVAGAVGLGDGAAAVVRSDTWEPLFLLVPAAVVTAAAAALSALLAWEQAAASRRRALVAAVVGLGAGLSTGYWSTASRGMWQHGPACFWFTAALLAAWYVQVGRSPRPMAVLVGAASTAAALTRPTFVILGAALLVWLVVEHRRLVLRAVAGAAAVAVPVMAVNLATFGSLMMPYYEASRPTDRPDPLLYGLAGLLFSPSRGALFFMPAAVLLAVWGLVRSVRSRNAMVLRLALAGGSVVFTLFVAGTPEGWWAGNSYGPRFLVDLIPVAAFLAVPAIECCVAGDARKPAVGAVIALVMWSVFVQGSGALVRQSACWNTLGGDLRDTGRARVWDLSDTQTLYGLRWVASGNSPLSDGCSGP